MMQIVNEKLYNWASQIDPHALLQAERTTRLPIVDRVALMPDAHVGLGSTVGSVIGTQGAIMPAAVGVDLGCVDMNSEFLSPDGWKRISDWDKDLVMQYSPNTELGEFVSPSQFIKREESSFLYLHTKYGIDQMLTPDHKILCWDVQGRDRHLVQTVTTAQDFTDRHNSLVLGNGARFQTTFTPNIISSLSLTDSELRVMVMQMADGHIDKSDSCVLQFKKDRKVQRAKQLLVDADINFTSGVNNDGVSWYRFTPTLPHKSYDWCWEASLEQLNIIVDEVFHWDGNFDERCFYTRDKRSADFIQYAFTATGSRGVLREDEHYRDQKIDYRVFAQPNTLTGMKGNPKAPIEIVPSPDGYAYCFTVPSGFWVMRRNGNIVITGNCGMIATETNITSKQLPDNLEPFLSILEETIPAGVGKGHVEGSKAAGIWYKHNKDKFATELDSSLIKKLLTQFGSLGSGNHFFEICVDESDVVWIVLHSGSRGLGNILASRHIKSTKELVKQRGIKLEDPDLAYLNEDENCFQYYIDDMLACQDYAKANRVEMMKNAFTALQKFIYKTNGVKIIKEMTINCHHNFTQKEIHGDEMLWITRKGAIKAGINDYGIIPGSMGTKTFIVRGLGNPLSYQSCAHGAGRLHSRSAAKKLFTNEDLEQAMEGKVWLKDKASSLIDESPGAYKDIYQVMEDQEDLIEPIHVLSQILNFKGA